MAAAVARQFMRAGPRAHRHRNGVSLQLSARLLRAHVEQSSCAAHLLYRELAFRWPSGASGLTRMSTEIDQNRRGLVKLMLKLPAVRGRLQILSATNAGVFSRCGAFEEASSTLDRLRSEDSQVNPIVLREYETLCEEIEQDILERCRR